MNFLNSHSLNLLLLILFPWKRLGSTRFDPYLGAVNPFKYPSLSRFLWKEQGLKWLAQFCVKLLAFFNQLFFLICLAQMVGDISFSSLPLFPWYALPISIFLRYVFAQIQLWIEFSLRNFYVHCLRFTFDSVIWTETSDRIFGRDVLASLQVIPYLVDGFYLITAFLSSLAIIFWINGWDATIGILTLLLFIPLSLKIASQRSLIAKQIYGVVKEKLDKIHQWLDWYPYLRSWGRSKGALSDIYKLMHSEINLRNQDSIWRGFDLYGISFGKLAPISIMIGLSLLTYPISSGLLTTLWLAVPIIGIIITFNRFIKEKVEGDTAFNELKVHLDQLTSESSLSEIRVKNDWEIWKGSLADNICEFHHEFDVLSKLHLKEELLDLNVKLELKGSNISSGQKMRLLLARGINLALRSKQPLYVNLTFESLDSNNQKRVLQCLQELTKWVPVHWETKEPLVVKLNTPSHDPVSYFRQESREQIFETNAATPSFFKDILQLFCPYFFLMFLPAMSLNILASITVMNISDQWRLALLFAIGLSAFAGVVWLGSRIEAHVRAWALERGYNILNHPTLWNRSDIFQRVSENYRTVCERISWYIHDGVWIAALLVFALASSTYIIGWISLAISGFFLGLCFFIWILGSPSIAFTRQATITGFNQYLEKMTNLVALSRSACIDILKAKKKEVSFEAWKSLFISQIEADATKFFFSTILYLLSGIVLVSISNLSIHAPHYEAASAMIISAFLYVDYNIIMFFQALTGFNAQRMAIHRLDVAPRQEPVLQSLFVKNKNSYCTLEFFNDLIDQKYPPYSFQLGKSYSIVGDSGTGKTLYLRCLAGLQPCRELDNTIFPREGIAYLDGHSLKILQEFSNESSFIHFIEEQLRLMKRIVIFDEALVHLPLDEAKMLSQLIAKRMEALQGLFLLVDHRFQLNNVLIITERECKDSHYPLDVISHIPKFSSTMD